jgi:hypothetical protein
VATDSGVRDAYLIYLQGQLQRRQSDMGKLQSKYVRARLEDSAQANLTSADNTLLIAAGVLDTDDPANVILAAVNALQAEIVAINHLVAIVKAAP